MPGSKSVCPHCRGVIWATAPESEKLYRLMIDVGADVDPISTGEIVEYVAASDVRFSDSFGTVRANNYLHILQEMGLVQRSAEMVRTRGDGMGYLWQVVKLDA